MYSKRDFCKGEWVCFTTDYHNEVDMISGEVESTEDKGVTISCENVVGPNDSTFFPFEAIDDLLVA